MTAPEIPDKARWAAYELAHDALQSMIPARWVDAYCAVDALLDSGVVILAAELKPLRDLHSEAPVLNDLVITYCSACHCGWPCESARLLSALMELEDI